MKQYKINLEDVITYYNYFQALKKCNKGVNFKYSVQEYNIHCIERIHETINSILKGNIPNVKNIEPVIIFERGKRRIITPIDISDRITQKVLCDNVLIPSIMPHLIFDNGASVKGKGTDFARKRLNYFLEKAKKEYKGRDFYVLSFDFKSYFDSIPHEQCYRVLNKYVSDKRLVNLTIGIIESYKLREIQSVKSEEERKILLERLYNHQEKGICLGSQISQIMAVAVPNEFDHYIKDKLRIKYYERYMDDGVIIIDDKDKLLTIKNDLSRVAQKYGLTFNLKKTHIVKNSKGFTFLKVKYHIAKDNKTIKRLVRSGIVRERRKLKKFRTKIKEHKMNLDDVYSNIQSWNAHSKIAKSYTTSKTIFKMYDDYFDGYRLTQKYYKKHPDINRERKVTRL